MKKINYTKCLSIKNKKSIKQCIHKHKKDSLFCGIHRKMLNIIRVDTLSDIYDCSLNNIKNKNLKYNIQLKNLKSNNIFNQKNINKDINILSIHKYNKLPKYKDNLLLKYDKNIKEIIKIQSIFKMYEIKRRYKCINKIDCITLKSIYEITPIYLYIYHQKNINKYFAFDIRYLNELLKTKPFINPYTNYIFTDNDIKKINKYINYINIIYPTNKYSINMDTSYLTPDQKLQSYVINTFHKIDLLGNYTDISWFNNLNKFKLYKLYYYSHNIFYNRVQLTHEERKNFVKNGNIFQLKYSKLRKIKDINKLKYLILDEYNKFLDYDTSMGNKKTSAIWLLIALTQVSKSARLGLSHLI